MARADVRRHVVRPLGVVDVARAFRRGLLEPVRQVGAHVRVGVLLDEERARGVAAEDGQQSVACALVRQPARDRPR